MRSCSRTSASVGRSLLGVAVPFIAALPCRGQTALPADFEPAWQAFVAEHRGALTDQNIVGGTVAFVHAGDVVAIEYYGMADVESGRPVDENTIYHWASITKTFTAVGLMQLYERGLIRLEDPIVDYVPELRRVHNPYGSMEEITLRHLLTHSAGFRSPTWPWAGDEPWHPHEPTEWSQLVAMIPYTDIEFEPGSRWQYSNPGSVFLGRTIEQVTGDVYEAYIEKNVLRPLDMRSAYFDITPWHLRHARSNSYRVVEGKPIAQGLDFNTGITVSNGGLNASVFDLAKWAGFLMSAPDSLHDAYEHVLAPATLDLMWERALPLDGDDPLGAAAEGLHFFVYDADGHRIIGHTGGQKSFVTFIYVAPDADVAIIGAYNTAGGDDTAPNTGSIFNLAKERARQTFFPMFWEPLESSP